MDEKLEGEGGDWDIGERVWLMGSLEAEWGKGILEGCKWDSGRWKGVNGFLGVGGG